jgi:hypothetical protein
MAHDTLLMFAKGKSYFYDQDPLRETLVRPYATPGRQKPGLMRRDANRDLRVISNPMGATVARFGVLEDWPSVYRDRESRQAFPPRR